MGGKDKSGLRLPAFFSDNMMLQRGMPAPVWGWAKPGEKVTVTVAGKSADAVAGADGKWLARVGPLAAGGPHELVVKAARQTLRIANVLAGDVWICSGQSNMGFTLSGANNGLAEIAGANFPQIRHLAVPQVTALTPQNDVRAAWSVCEPRTAGAFTAVGYFFARKLHRDLDVPIGLVNSSWGGSNCETWCSTEALAAEPALQHMVVGAAMSDEAYQQALAEHASKLSAWDAQVSYQDPGNTGFAQGWAAPDCDVTDWRVMDLPRAWETIPGMAIDGAVWFRKEVDIPVEWAGTPLRLSLGAIDDFDTTYFNGVEIGGTGKETPNWWMTPRNYTVPGKLVKQGKAIIAVRVFDRMGNGGLVGGGHSLSLTREGQDKAIRLEGNWWYKIEVAYDPKPMVGGPAMPVLPGQMNAPCALYNAMIAPLIPYGVKGAIWYQGESNADRGYQYRTLFPTMIRDWRRRWGQGDFPFLFVQLANYMVRRRDPTESGWAELREAQTLTLKEPNTGMAVAIDIGDAGDIHPRNKQDVGMRLAMAAEGVAYGSDVLPSGPLYKSMRIEGSAIRLSFDHVGKGLVEFGGRLTGFAIAGAAPAAEGQGNAFVWADARIDGDTVVVSSPAVPKPVAVRYGWADNPDCSLYNEAGLPAVPFRTDDWPILSGPK